LRFAVDDVQVVAAASVAEERDSAVACHGRVDVQCRVVREVRLVTGENDRDDVDVVFLARRTADIGPLTGARDDDRHACIGCAFLRLSTLHICRASSGGR